MHRLGNRKRAWRVSREHVDLSGSAGTRDANASAGASSAEEEADASSVISFEAQPQRLTLDLERTAIIVVDMQNDFCSPGGWLDSIGVDTAPLLSPVDPLNRLLPALRAADVPVVWLNWGNRPDRLNLSPSVLHVYNPDGAGVGIGDPLPGNGSLVLEKGSWGAALIDGLVPEQEDVRVDKYRMSGFWDTPLDSILRNMDITTLLFAGVNLDQCVMHTLQDAGCLGYDVVLLADCCATSSPDYCAEGAIYNIKQCYGFVAESADVLGALAANYGKVELR
ncbi:cysteine hydrolase family protein [Paenibacillus sacheonensis]|uniref:Isochorismatase family protein n=1 Tax=Paenibacillus sacheonensis TaxID=742054 RepID=A0A7X5BZY5_9BACL|nr:cysteine hydrolase family protein [Paenibacillus sacheonensis]MBM7566018.1 nicotinamidase-related amidase [Paenibacillus sacheonensis]NBC68670.1 isochorismatase family protein [Paenibacillus sacheonensis]